MKKALKEVTAQFGIRRETKKPSDKQTKEIFALIKKKKIWFSGGRGLIKHKIKLIELRKLVNKKIKNHNFDNKPVNQ